MSIFLMQVKSFSLPLEFVPKSQHDLIDKIIDGERKHFSKFSELRKRYDKVGAVFGSYGWSGEAPRLVLEIMKNKFEMQVIEPPLLLKYAPDQAGLEKCREFGKRIAEKLMLRT